MICLLTRRPRPVLAAGLCDPRTAVPHRGYIPARHRRRLAIVATPAEDISGYGRREPRAGEWMVTAGHLRATAVTESGQILDGLYLAGDTGLRDAAGGVTGERGILWRRLALCGSARAGIPRGLGERSSCVAVLDQLAAIDRSASRRSGVAARRILAALPARES